MSSLKLFFYFLKALHHNFFQLWSDDTSSHKWAKENNKGRKGLGDYDSFWIFVEQHYSDKAIKSKIEEVKKKFPTPQ